MIVLITGASSGIGEATARMFALNGARLILAARRIERLHKLTAELPTDSHLVELDVRDRYAVRHTVESLPEPFAAIDILVNNAGLSRGLEPVHEGSEDDWDEMIDTNVKGLLYVTRAVLPGMVSRGHGHVINVGSIAGYQNYPNGNVYCASKAAVRALNNALRIDLHGTGIRVSSVDPGMTETEFSEVRFHGDQTRAAKVYEDIRPLTAADIADAIVWCASRPPWVNIENVLMTTVDQSSARMFHRRPLAAGEAPVKGPLAERWLAAWNARDLNAMVALYAPDARHTSEHVRALGETETTLSGREAIVDYFRRGIEKYPSLRFEPISVSTGPRTVVVEYQRHGVGPTEPTVEILETDERGLIAHSRMYHC